jgi:hypothetical protein
VALSTTKNEYSAEALATQEAAWLPQLLIELGILGFLKEPITIYADNNGAIALASNPEFCANTKHIVICFYCPQVCIVRFVNIPTAEVVTDGMTTPMVNFYKEYRIQ